VSREDLPWLGLVILLLAASWFVGQRALTPEAHVPAPGFREWLWETRSLDLAVQVCIVFVGALGIAALLPRNDESEGE
jgi:hypothetical protein